MTREMEGSSSWFLMTAVMTLGLRSGACPVEPKKLKIVKKQLHVSVLHRF